MIIVQVALVAALLVVSGLLVRTLQRMQGLEPGFEPDNLLTASVSLDDARYGTANEVAALFERAAARVRQTPGVESVAVGLSLPYQRPLNLGFKLLTGDDQRPQGTDFVYVTPGFFETLRIPIHVGRDLSGAGAAGGSRDVVVNRRFAEMYLTDADPIGFPLATAGGEARIVGVAGDVMQRTGLVRTDPLGPSPTIYIDVRNLSDPTLQLVHQWFRPSWVVRKRPDVPAALALAEMRKAIESADPLLPIASLESMAETQAGAWERQRMQALLAGSLALLAAALAAIGIYGLIAQIALERRRETGLRLALGASVAQAIRTAAAPGLKLTLAGLGIGGALAYYAGQAARSLIWGVAPTDPVSYAASAGLLLAVAACASLAPALKIARLNPASVLREE